MTRALTIVPLFVLLGCGSQALAPAGSGQQARPIPAVAVNDPCSAYTTATACEGALGPSVGTNLAGRSCTWTAVEACPAGATCPSGVCTTISACAGLTTADACAANPSCVWSEILATASAPALCPVGQDCSSGGFCFQRDSSAGGTTCLCVQPLACPANGACPPVQCDCPSPQPVDAGSGGGGTCTCGCPACLPGEACPPCDCQCGTGGGAGGAGGGARG